MGRGKSWSRDESLAVTEAWKQVSQTHPSVREQNSKKFANELYRRFLDLAPSEITALDGRWCSRSQSAVKNQFDAIGDDIMRFNVVLSSVVDQAAVQGISVADARVLRASIGVHVGACSSVVDFDHIKSVESDWKLFGAWQILRTCSRFAPLNWSASKQEPPLSTERDTDANPQMEDEKNSQFQDSDRPLMPPPPTLPNGGSTPMRTLATAAVSAIPLSASDAPPGKKKGTSQHAVKVERNLHWRKTGATLDAANLSDGRPIKRRRPVDVEGEQPTQRVRKHASVDGMPPGWKALESVGEQLGALADALTEYNALTLFSKPEMQGKQERVTFLNAMAEKHALKATLDRDKLLRETQRKGDRNKGAASG